MLNMTNVLNLEHHKLAISRARDFKEHQRNVENYCTSFTLRIPSMTLKIEHDEVENRAINLFVASRVKKLADQGTIPSAECLVSAYHALSDTQKREYCVAALMHDPKYADTYCSNAFITFLDLHVRMQQTQDYNKTRALQEAKTLWRQMDKHERLPFHLKAYLSTYIPREMDAACPEFYGQKSD